SGIILEKVFETQASVRSLIVGMRPSVSLPLLLSVSTAANAIPLLDRLLHLRDAKPPKNYSVVNVEGSPATDSPTVVTVTQSPVQVTVTQRITDPVSDPSSAVQTSTSSTLIIVNVDATTVGASTTVTVYPALTPTPPESSPLPPATTSTTPPPAPPEPTSAVPEPPSEPTSDAPGSPQPTISPTSISAPSSFPDLSQGMAPSSSPPVAVPPPSTETSPVPSVSPPAPASSSTLAVEPPPLPSSTETQVVPSSSWWAPIVSSTVIALPPPSTETWAPPSEPASTPVEPSTVIVAPPPLTVTPITPSYTAPPEQGSSASTVNTTSSLTSSMTSSLSTPLASTTESGIPPTPTQVYETTSRTTWEQTPSSLIQPSTFVTSVVSVTAPSPVPTSQSYDDGHWNPSKYPEWTGIASATPRYRR
ncbi:hypothetical protein LX32DRAFT_597377, partial [Colletotrichum zoysiae]